MSTRAQIGIYESREQNISKPSVLIYKHSGGYPEGLLPIITPFLARFDKERGISDTEYCGAWLVHELITKHIQGLKEWRVEIKTVFPSNQPDDDGYDFLGHGICQGFHGDIEYFYRVSPGVIEVYETPDGEDPKGYKKIKTIKLAAA